MTLDLQNAIHDLSVELADMTRRHDEVAVMLEAISDCAPSLIWSKDLEGRYLFANKAHCEWLGVPAPKGMSDLEIAWLNRAQKPDDPHYYDFGEVCGNSDEITLENMKPMRFLEGGNVRGVLFYLQVFKAPLFDRQGKLIGTVGVAHDVTERIQVRESLLRDLLDVAKEHGIREPFLPLLKRFEAYCNRHRFTQGQE